MEDYHKDVWMEIIDGVNKTVARFDIPPNDFKEMVLEVYRNEEKIYYLRELRKPPTMGPRKSLLKIRTANHFS